MTRPDDADAVLAVFREELSSTGRWLAALGYTAPTLTVQPRDSLGDTVLEARFHAPTREALFYLVIAPKADAGATRRHVLLVVIYRRGPDADANDPRQALYLDWFAAVHRRELSDRLEDLADRRDPWPQFIRAALPIYRTLMDTDLRDVVAGHDWQAGTGVVSIARAFDFLVTEYGFSPPEGFSAGVQVGNRYRRGDVELCLSFEGGFLMSMRAEGGEPRFVEHLDVDAALAFLKAHPEVASGDFRAVDRLPRTRR